MSEQPFISIKNYYERTVSIDDAEGSVVTLPIRVRRFTKEQLIDFSIGLKRCRNRAADRYLTRKPDTDEQEKTQLDLRGVTVTVPVIPDEEIRRRRLLEMNAEERAKFEELDAADERFIVDFCAKAIAEHVWVKPGIRLMLEDAQGVQRQLTTGQDLVEAFAGNATLQRALVNAIEEENALSAEEKKRSRLRSALSTSSPASSPPADGVAPDATAKPVNGKDSAASGPASEALATIPSGSTVM
jgi:hypothetical protein